MKNIRFEQNKKLNKTDVINFYKLIIGLQLLLSMASVRTGRQVVFICSFALLVVFVIYGLVIMCLRVFKKFPSEKENNISLAMLCVGYSSICSIGFAIVYSEKLTMFFAFLLLMMVLLVAEYFVVKRIYNKKSKEPKKNNDPLSSVMIGFVAIIGACLGVFYPMKDFNLVMAMYYFVMSLVFACSYSNVLKAKELDQSDKTEKGSMIEDKTDKTGDGSVSCDKTS